MTGCVDVSHTCGLAILLSNGSFRYDAAIYLGDRAGGRADVTGFSDCPFTKHLDTQYLRVVIADC